MRKKLTILIFIITFVASSSFGFIEFNLLGVRWSSGLAPEQLEPIEYTASDGTQIKVYSTIPLFTQEIVEKVVVQSLSQLETTQLDDSKQVPIYLESTLCAEKGLQTSDNCYKKTFLGALYPERISNFNFYFTARHILVGKSDFGKISFALNFNLNDYQIFELQSQDDKNNKFFEDLLVFVPVSYLNHQCPNDGNCAEKIRKDLIKHFAAPVNKSFWIGLQPKVNFGSEQSRIEEDQEQQSSFDYSAGNIQSVDIIKDRFINSDSEFASLMTNYSLLVKNVSNFSEPGASGSMIREFKVDNSKNNVSSIGKPIGIVLCNWNINKNVNYTLVLSVNKTLEKSWAFRTVELDELVSQKNQAFPFDQLKNSYVNCVPIDGRGAGGPGD